MDFFYQKKINREILDFKVDEFKEDAINNLRFSNLIFSEGNFFCGNLNDSHTEKEINNRRRTFMESDLRGDRFNLGTAFGGKGFLF